MIFCPKILDFFSFESFPFSIHIECQIFVNIYLESSSSFIHESSSSALPRSITSGVWPFSLSLNSPWNIQLLSAEPFRGHHLLSHLPSSSSLVKGRPSGRAGSDGILLFNFEEVVIFGVSRGAPTDPLEEVLIFTDRHTDRPFKEVIFFSWHTATSS